MRNKVSSNITLKITYSIDKQLWTNYIRMGTFIRFMEDDTLVVGVLYL